MQFFNRLAGSIAKEPPDRLLILGQWQVLTESQSLFINTFELPPNSREYLFPDTAQRWTLRSTNGTLRCEKHFPLWQLPSDILAESLRFFERELQKLVSNSATWIDWVKVPPLVPEIEQKINIQPLEVKTKQDLGHVEEVCHRPRTYLKLETERLPVSRAQRISPHATEFLASHTEDWEKRTFRSVLPKRVLCMVREELWDIYENKVTARLIDNLLEYIRQRIKAVQTLKRELEEAEYFSGESRDIHWRNRERIYRLWGNRFDAKTEVQKAEATLRELQQLQYKLLGLTDTDLYQSIPKRAVVGITLKKTNILVNDQHYRYVDLLWREWSRWQGGQTKNSRQVFEENKELFRGFESFCLLLIGLALTDGGKDDYKGLGFSSVNNVIPNRGDRLPIDFQGALGEVSLHWQEDGSFLLQSEGINKLRLIPILATLTATNNPISAIVETFCNSITAAENPTVILYPGTDEERKKLPLDLQRKMNTLGNDRLPSESAMAILPVSPLDILSVERIARAIQWWLIGQRYQSYPPILPLNIPDTLLENAGWLKKDNRLNQVQVLRLPIPKEEQDFQTRLARLMKEAGATGPKGKGQLLDLEKLLKSNLPSQAQQLIQPLALCPTCHLPGTFKPLESLCFLGECSECGSYWGTKTCRSCGKKYPFIQLNTLEENDRVRQPGWVDRIVGRDVLAIPCWMEHNQDTFICSSCGICSQAEQTASVRCLRCNPVLPSPKEK